VREILTDPLEIFPKNDLMVGALRPLVGDSIFVSDGDTWRRQRAMVDPAFSHMRVGRAFEMMSAAVQDYMRILDARADGDEAFSLDFAMSELTADVICRTVFSKSLEGQTASDVFEAFSEFERSVASVDLKELIIGKPWADIRQPRRVEEACERIRRHIGALVDPRLETGADQLDDIVGSVINARCPNDGSAFSREELIDQIGVFFLAGHETTASVLTWAFFILAHQPEALARIREEVFKVAGDGEISFQHVKQLSFTRNVFRECLRLYPPITFIPRVARSGHKIGDFTVKRGAMIMISPWTSHRHSSLWSNPDRFDPDRFGRDDDSGVLMSFGLGPRVCVGAAFATIEATLILAMLLRRYEFAIENAASVRPVSRLTTRPAEQITCGLRRLGS
jgi:cytochrome P450